MGNWHLLHLHDHKCKLKKARLHGSVSPEHSLIVHTMYEERSCSTGLLFILKQSKNDVTLFKVQISGDYTLRDLTLDFLTDNNNHPMASSYIY